jgi:hypothetical protein
MLGLKKLVFISFTTADCLTIDFILMASNQTYLTVKTMLKCHSKAQQKLFERRKTEKVKLSF